MPSKLSTPRTDVRSANLDRARQLQYLQTLEVRGPFLGLVMDIDPNHLPPGAARRMENLRARAAPDGSGELLMLPPGFSQIDPDRLPLDGGDEIIMLGQLARVSPTTGAPAGDADITPLALTAGDNTPGAPPGDPARLYRIDPSGAGAGQWDEITYSAAGGSPANGTMVVDRDNSGGDHFGLPHMCTFAPGAPTVDAVVRSYSGAVTQPVAIICTNFDTVKIYPRNNAVDDEYEDLTGVAGLAPFLAKSCASWNDRVYFLNTSENNVRYNRRIRRTARGTANPDPSILGSGATDANDFQRAGLRLEPMDDDILAVYFEDGVAFNYKTGVTTNPDALRTLTRERGLLGTHAMCAIGSGQHFGIFNDGWFILSADGSWREVGLSNIGDVVRRKWSEYFYQNLDYEHRHRLYCYYIRDFNQVAIVVPVVGQADEPITEVWTLDLVSDRVYMDKYDCTVIGGYDIQIVADIRYMDIPVDGVDTYADAGTAGWTYASIGPRFALEGMVHGTTTGYVFAHHSQDPRRDGAYNFNWLWETPVRSDGATRYLLTADRIVVEYINQPGVTGTAVAFSGTNPLSLQTRALNLATGTLGTVQSARTNFRFSAASMGLRLTGQGPVMIRAFDFDMLVPKVESLRG